MSDFSCPFLDRLRSYKQAHGTPSVGKTTIRRKTYAKKLNLAIKHPGGAIYIR
jgi:hypothetical protein